MDRNLRAFLAVADAGNLTAAADKIGLAQPSLSKRLANLEAELRVKLFIRHRRGMELTTAGQHFYQRAKRIEQEYLQASEELSTLNEAGLDVLRVGAGPLFHLRYVAPAFVTLQKEFPELALELFADTNSRTIPMLKSGHLDVVLGVIEASRIEDSIAVRPLLTVEHGVAVHPSDRISQYDAVEAGELADRQWIVHSYADDRDMEHWLAGYFSARGMATPAFNMRTSSFTTGLQMVHSGAFTMAVPIQLRPVIEATGLHVVRAEPPITQLPAGAYVRRSSLGIQAVTRFIDIIADEAGDGDGMLLYSAGR